jgi:predicted ATP-grasp superfamily ATP-dependent carboligase
MHAIVLDGQLKSALAATRALGRKGVVVVGGAERISALSLHSKYTKKRFTYASPKKHPDQFLRDIESLARSLGERPVIFTFSDATSLLLSREYEKVKEWAALPFCEPHAVEVAADKKKTYELAKRLSIPVIKTHTKEAFESLAFPAVVKNRHSILWREGRAKSGSAHFVFTREELLQTFTDITEETGEEPLVMDFVRGE